MTKLSQNYNQTLTCPEGGGESMTMAGGGNSAMTLTGVDGDQMAAEMQVLDDLRARVLASEPEHLAEFDAFVAQWWGDGGSQLSVASAFAAAAVPEPVGAWAVGLVTGGLLRRRRRACRGGRKLPAFRIQGC